MFMYFRFGWSGSCPKILPRNVASGRLDRRFSIGSVRISRGWEAVGANCPNTQMASFCRLQSGFEFKSRRVRCLASARCIGRLLYPKTALLPSSNHSFVRKWPDSDVSLSNRVYACSTGHDSWKFPVLLPSGPHRCHQRCSIASAESPFLLPPCVRLLWDLRQFRLKT